MGRIIYYEVVGVTFRGGGRRSETFYGLFGGVENKMPWGQGVIYFVKYWGAGSDVFHWSLFSLKVIAFWDSQTRL